VEEGNRTPPGEYPSDRDSLDEICKDFFTSSWPWEREAESHYDLVSFKSGTPDLPNYGDARGFKDDPRDLNPLYSKSEATVRSLHFQCLFWKMKYFDNKRLSKDLKALTQS
jgi:hypothetical protein